MGIDKEKVADNAQTTEFVESKGKKKRRASEHRMEVRN